MKYHCIKSVVMEDTNEVEFTEGKTYEFWKSDAHSGIEYEGINNHSMSHYMTKDDILTYFTPEISE